MIIILLNCCHLQDLNLICLLPSHSLDKMCLCTAIFTGLFFIIICKVNRSQVKKPIFIKIILIYECCLLKAVVRTWPVSSMVAFGYELIPNVSRAFHRLSVNVYAKLINTVCHQEK